MLVENLQRIIKRGARETARRAAKIYKQIFEFAEAAGITPPNQIGNLSRTLPAKRVEHFAAVTDPEKLGALLKALDSYSGTMPVCCALKLAPLLFSNRLCSYLLSLDKTIEPCSGKITPPINVALGNELLRFREKNLPTKKHP